MAQFASPPPISPLIGSNPLQDLLAGFTTGRQLAQLPQQQEQAALQAQLAAALNQAKLAQIQDALANPNRELENALRLEGARNTNNIELEKLRQQGKLGVSEQLGVEFFQDPVSKQVMARRIPFAGEPAAASSLFTGEAPNLGVPEAPALTFEQPPATDLSSQIQQLITGSVPTGPSTLTGRIAQEEEARLTREEAARKAKSEESETGRKFKTSEREAHETFLKGMSDKKLDAEIEKAAAKSKQGFEPTGEERQRFRTTVNVFLTLDEINKKVDEMEKTGKYPGVGQTFIDEFLAQKAQDIPLAKLIPGVSGAYAEAQKALREAQTPEARQLAAMRAELTANIIRAQAGLSQTTGEISNVLPYTPSNNDTIDSLRDKLANLNRLARRDIYTFGLVYPGFQEIKIPGYDASSSGNPNVPVIQAPVRTSGTSTDGIKFELAKPSQ